MSVEIQLKEYMRKLKVIISGGGTGGHIFPALAIARAIEKKNSEIEFLFVGAIDRMEMQKIPSEGYKIIGLWISGLQRKIHWKNFLFPFKLIHSLFRSIKIINQFDPDFVIGTGGYASGPLLYIASRKGIPTIIQEQNSFPGITNRILGNYVQNICVAYDNMHRYFPKSKIIKTGNPIRKDILSVNMGAGKKNDLFDISKSNPTVLVLGGSLGAKSINNAIANNLHYISKLGINLIWQTGIAFSKKAHELIIDLNKPGIHSCDFIREMDKAYEVADIIISRAGAIAISELCCVGKPIILVPSPNVSENHQYKNAQSLVNKNAALMVEDTKSSCKLVKTLEELINDKLLQSSLRRNIKKIAVNDAAERIAKIALDLVK